MKHKKLNLFLAFVLLLTACFCAVLSACNQKPDYLSSVSELRKDVFVGEKDNFCVTVYSGSKEDPTVFDGIKNQTVLSLTFKVTQKEEVGKQLTLKFQTGDKRYTAPLDFDPVKSTLSCDVVVSALPERTFDVEICDGEQSTVVTTISKLNENTISYVKALEIATEKNKTFLSSHTKNGVLNCEIIIRLLCENERNYYYVGFVCDGGLKVAYLLNGETGEIIAEKQN